MCLLITLALSCILNRSDHFPYGIHDIRFYLKTSIYVYIINPGSFYDVERKLNKLVLDNSRKYKYKIRSKNIDLTQILSISFLKILNIHQAECM